MKIRLLRCQIKLYGAMIGCPGKKSKQIIIKKYNIFVILEHAAGGELFDLISRKEKVSIIIVIYDYEAILAYRNC